MLAVAETIFWLSFFALFYIYAGYPILLLLFISIKRMVNRKVRDNHYYAPPVTLIVPAYNEADILDEKIRNCLSLNYPTELLKLIIITDGSTDNIEWLSKKYPDIIHLHEPPRIGKLSAMNRAMKYVQTEFVIFSDANTLMNKESIALILRHYRDPKVGGVSGEKKILTDSSDGPVSKGEGLYWKYESLLKNLDSQLYSVVGAAGELFSIRSSLYTYLPDNTIIEDFVQSLTLCEKGYVVKYEPAAWSTERASLSVKDEMGRKIRIAAGGFQAMARLGKLFNLFRYPLLTFQYVSHRVLRWTIGPIALVLMLLANIFIYCAGRSAFYSITLLFQLLVWVMAGVGWRRARSNSDPGIFSMPFYLLFMNFCVFAGFARFVSGKQDSAWQKAQRSKKI